MELVPSTVKISESNSPQKNTKNTILRGLSISRTRQNDITPNRSQTLSFAIPRRVFKHNTSKIKSFSLNRHGDKIEHSNTHNKSLNAQKSPLLTQFRRNSISRLSSLFRSFRRSRVRSEITAEDRNLNTEKTPNSGMDNKVRENRKSLISLSKKRQNNLNVQKATVQSKPKKSFSMSSRHKLDQKRMKKKVSPSSSELSLSSLEGLEFGYNSKPQNPELDSILLSSKDRRFRLRSASE